MPGSWNNLIIFTNHDPDHGMDVPPMIFTGNPLIIKPGMVFSMHMILMDSKAQLAMNLGETYLVTETGNERLGKQKLDLVIL